RRHTRSKRDWSSDVCSSDLGRPPASTWRNASEAGGSSPDGTSSCPSAGRRVWRVPTFSADYLARLAGATGFRSDTLEKVLRLGQIGRASCRERVWRSVVDG